MSSPLASEVRPGPVTIASTGASRRPFGPAMTQLARAVISAGTLSAAGEALQRLPANDARRPGLAQPFVLVDHYPGGRGADYKAVAFVADADHSRYSLGVDDDVGPHPTR